ncbi:hypothetical protein [Seleniivibrio sp.]|uniref:hypothetical protein n=1 Tax=Seleniivibrio sp. TaxID=2898801 RepID=UPI0025EB52D1|nr:hypothetical protein [Seleniivibrio sp.]MCD8552899.1 hypothetical protein [Seleniivibrio sp.]
MSFLIPDIFVQLVLYSVMIFFLCISLFVGIRVILHWDISDTSETQYVLEKHTYLVSVLMKYIFAVNIPAFIIFIYANDKLSAYLTGAMCAAGVLNATIYGKYLMGLKIINLYLSAAWLTVNSFDLKNEALPFTYTKFSIIPLFFATFIAEAVLFVLHFASIDPTVPVSCCNVIFADNTSIFRTFISDNAIYLFAGSFALTVLNYSRPVIYGAANILLAVSGIAVLIYKVSPYVYELPTHQCPFCILQSGYGYVGYAFYITLFTGTALGISAGFQKLISGIAPKKMFFYSMLFNIAYLLLCAWFPLSYFFRNKTWL